MSARIISVINQKGGVGKTSISVNLPYSLALKNKRILIIDLDPQAHSSVIYCDNIKENESISVAFKDKEYDIRQLIRRAILFNNTENITDINNLDIIPSTIKLFSVVDEISGRLYREQILKNHIEKIKNEYDFIFIDCPPTIGLLVVNALYASSHIVIPINYGRYALDGMADLLRVIHDVKKGQFKYFILRNLYDKRNKQTNEFIEQLLYPYNKYLFKTIISKNESINQAQIKGIPVQVYDNSCKGTLDFYKLSEELLLNV